MKKQILLAALAAGSAIAGQRLARRYQLDHAAAYARLAAVTRTTVVTRFGTVEYAECGRGEPLLAIHGFFGGCDEALLSLRGLAAGRRTIAPSRFGYLGSSMPPDATVAGQADAFAALLDELGLKALDVIAISSGATSAFQFALRHPDRVKHLAVISGNMPAGAAASVPPQTARLVFRDVPMWALKVLARPVLLRQIGVPKGFPLSAGDARIVSDLIDSFFPVALKTKGVAFDAFVSDPDVNSYPLEALTVPVLVVHAKDDHLVSYDAARNAARRIPGARLVSMDRGGHLLLGDRKDVAREVTAFLVGHGASLLRRWPTGLALSPCRHVEHLPDRGHQGGRALITSCRASIRKRPPGPGLAAAVKDGRAPAFCGQISSGYRTGRSSAVSLSTGHRI